MDSTLVPEEVKTGRAEERETEVRDTIVAWRKEQYILALWTGEEDDLAAAKAVYARSSASSPPPAGIEVRPQAFQRTTATDVLLVRPHLHPSHTRL